MLNALLSAKRRHKLLSVLARQLTRPKIKLRRLLESNAVFRPSAWHPPMQLRLTSVPKPIRMSGRTSTDYVSDNNRRGKYEIKLAVKSYLMLTKTEIYRKPFRYDHD